MFGFRATITCAVMAFIVALAALLILIQTRTFNLTTEQAASAYMDAASAKSFGRLQSQVAEIVTLVRVLSASPNLADSDERTETDRGIALLKAALHALPQMDSVYVGYDNGSWLQVRNLDQVNNEQRERLRASPEAAFNIHLIRPTPTGALPLRRIFQDRLGDQLEQLDLWKYGYDARKRSWYRDTMRADRLLISSPYLSFTMATPVITVSAPLRGAARGVVAADLKLDTFSDFVNEQRTRRAWDCFDIRFRGRAHRPSRAQAICRQRNDASFRPETPQRQGARSWPRSDGLEGMGWRRPL